MPRKDHTHHYIYKTTCSVTDRFYIGMHSTSNLEDGYVGSGKRLWLSINKHGKKNHSVEILEWYENRKSLKLREKEIVNEDLLKDHKCMNICLGGSGGFISEKGYKLGAKRMNEIIWNSADHRKMHSIRVSILAKKLHLENKLHKASFKGLKHSVKTKNKIGLANSIKQKGEGNSQFGTIWIHNIELKENKKIKKEDFINYPNWIKGRRTK